jgi:3-deoxy-D-manno-octulosonate 8-phosphate phosphatase (KDO 8-P phosphatase)
LFEISAAQQLSEKLKNIKLVVCDVDGVLTDGGLYYDANGLALKKFNVKDGMAVRLLREVGIEMAVVTTDISPMILARAKRLEIRHCYIGEWDKERKVSEICNSLNITLEQTIFIGDDINDLKVIKEVGLGACPADAVSKVKAVADYVCQRKGGEGVLREITEMVLSVR